MKYHIIERDSWRKIKDLKYISCYLCYPIESESKTVKRFVSEIKSSGVNLDKTVSYEGIDKPFIAVLINEENREKII